MALAGAAALLILQARATTVFPIANNNSLVQACGGLAFDGTNYLAALQSSSAVAAQLLSPAGAALGSEIKVGTNLSFPPAIAVAYGGGVYLEAWSDNFKVSTRSYEESVFAQAITPGGEKAGAAVPLLASLGSHGFQTLQGIAYGGGVFLAVWQDSIGDTLYGQLATAGSAGVTLVAARGSIGPERPEFLISDQQGNGASAAVASDGTNFFVVWQSKNRKYCQLEQYIRSVCLNECLGYARGANQPNRVARRESSGRSVERHELLGCLDQGHQTRFKGLAAELGAVWKSRGAGWQFWRKRSSPREQHD